MRCVVLKMKLLRNKFIVCTSIIISVYLYLFYVLLTAWNIWPLPMFAGLSSVKLPYVVVHIDLKGAPLKLKYLESILPMLKKHGANGLLIEYEDMFPYDGKLVNISSKNCYGKTELKDFLRAAVQLEFEVIPLIQTFGHMEHVLKLQEFMHLREVLKYPNSICPSKTESRVLIFNMLEQVIYFHFSVVPLKYIHIGCDEVFNIYKCQQCINKEMPILEFFTNHVRFVADAVSKLSPGTTVLIWDDMLRNVYPMDFKYLNPIPNVEPVYWRYGSFEVSNISLYNYHQKFKNIWIASAFKGADGIIASVPILKDRLRNHFDWMNYILDYKFGGEKNVYEFKGIILTGWSRYSHFDPLCELFPVAIPSLVANLILIDKFKKGFHYDKSISNLTSFYTKYGWQLSREFSKSLKCEKTIPPKAFVATTSQMYLENCDFESQDLYNLMNDYENFKNEVEVEFHVNNYKIYASLEFYAKAKFVNVYEQERSLKWFKETLDNYYNFDNIITKIMKNYYSDNVIREYVDFKTYSWRKNLEYHIDLLSSLNLTRVWGRNPFNTIT